MHFFCLHCENWAILCPRGCCFGCHLLFHCGACQYEAETGRRAEDEQLDDKDDGVPDPYGLPKATMWADLKPDT